MTKNGFPFLIDLKTMEIILEFFRLCDHPDEPGAKCFLKDDFVLNLTDC